MSPIRISFAAAFLAVCAMFSSSVFAGTSSEGPGSKSRFNDLSINSGYTWGDVRYNDRIKIVPFSIRKGFDISRSVGMDGPGVLQLGIEPFFNTIIEPDEGYEAGLNVGLRYIAPVSNGVSFYGEILSGPMYLSIDTVEQDEPGLNFLSQIGAGIQVDLSSDVAFITGYRWRHLSNANLRKPNMGINTNYILAGFSFVY